MNRTSLRPVVSLLLIIFFVISFVSGIGLYQAPNGRIAKETSWNFLGMDKWKLENIHTMSSFVMSGLVLLHIFLDYKLLLTGLRNLFKK